MVILEQLMQRSQFTIIVISAVLFLVGPPRKKVRYRILVAAVAVLSVFSAFQWYATYIVGRHYFREEEHWPYLIPTALFAIGAGVLVFELVSLRLFRRLTSDEKSANQPPETTRRTGP